MTNTKSNKQAGFIIMMGMLMLVLGAAAWFATYGSLQSNAMKLAKNDKGIAQLQHVKDKFLAYAAAHPKCPYLFCYQHFLFYYLLSF